MNQLVRRIAVSPPVVISGVLLYGVIEFVALQRSQLRERVVRH